MHDSYTPPAVRCTAHPPRWAERCPSVSPPPLALCTAARDRGESHLGSSLSKHCRCYTSAGWISSADPHIFLHSPPSHPEPRWVSPLRQRILCRAPAAGPVFSYWVGVEWRECMTWISTCSACPKLYQQTIPKCQSRLPVGTFSAPQKPHLLHFGLQLLLPGPAAVQQGQPLLQACVLPDCQLDLLLCSLSPAPLRSYLALEGLDGASESRIFLLWVLVSISVVGRAVWWPESIHAQAIVSLVPEPGQGRVNICVKMSLQD